MEHNLLCVRDCCAFLGSSTPEVEAEPEMGVLAAGHQDSSDRWRSPCRGLERAGLQACVPVCFPGCLQ